MRKIHLVILISLLNIGLCFSQAGFERFLGDKYELYREDFNHYGLIQIKEKGVWKVGAMNLKGEIVIPIIYKDLQAFFKVKNQILVEASLPESNSTNSIYGVINSKNEIIIPIKYHSVGNIGFFVYECEKFYQDKNPDIFDLKKFDFNKKSVANKKITLKESTTTNSTKSKTNAKAITASKNVVIKEDKVLPNTIAQNQSIERLVNFINNNDPSQSSIIINLFPGKDLKESIMNYIKEQQQIKKDLKNGKTETRDALQTTMNILGKTEPNTNLYMVYKEYTTGEMANYIITKNSSTSNSSSSNSYSSSNQNPCETARIPKYHSYDGWTEDLIGDNKHKQLFFDDGTLGTITYFPTSRVYWAADHTKDYETEQEAVAAEYLYQKYGCH